MHLGRDMYIHIYTHINISILTCIHSVACMCVCVCVRARALLCLVAQLWLTLCDSMDYSQPGSSVHGDSPGKNTGVGFHALLQGIFPIQGLNPGLPHCRQILYHLGHQGSPFIYIYIHTHIYVAYIVQNAGS